MFLVLLPAVFSIALLVLSLLMYQRQGTLGLAKLVLVLIGAISGLMWLVNRLSVTHESTQLNELLSVLPWGTVWIADTVILIVFIIFTHKNQDSVAT